MRSSAWTPCRRPAQTPSFQALLGDDPNLEALKPLLIARTAGNPFFLEESVRTLVETGVLVGARGAYRAAQTLASIQVPATVQAVLAARIDRLSPEAKRLLQTAAVIGHEVPLPLLDAIAEVPEADVHRVLAHLQAAEFLYDTRLFPERELRFKHALTHEVAYGSLLQERRRALHTRIVEALEARVGDPSAEQVERLAHHALRGEVWAKAAAYCRQAGEKALARSVHREAAAYFEQALQALAHLPEQHDRREQAIDLRLALRTALSPSGHPERLLACLREAEALAEALADPQRLGQVSLFLSHYFYTRGAYDQAFTAAQRAARLVTASGDGLRHALANQYLGRAYERQGHYRQAIACVRQTVDFLDGARQHERFGQVFLPAVMCRAYLAVCHAEVGAFADGAGVGEEGLRLAEVVQHPGSLILALWGSGLLALRQGDLPRALPRLERAVELCQDADFPILFPWMAATLGAAYALSGRVTDTVTRLTQQATQQAIAMERADFQTLCGLSCGEVQMLAGRLEEAQALAQGTLAQARAQQERGNEAYALCLLGDIAARCEPLERASAEAYYRQALALAEELGMRPLQAHCHRGLGTLYATTGQQELARTELATAIDRYRSMDMTFWLPQTEVVLAQVEGR
jgi:tetratricopeptide (TPR) repeat protein